MYDLRVARGSQSGVVIALWENPEGWIIESTCFHRPNVVSCKLISGDQQTVLIGSCLSPSTLDHMPDLEEALKFFLFRDPVVLRDLNADISGLRNPRYQQVADFLESFRMVNILDNDALKKVVVARNKSERPR